MRIFTEARLGVYSQSGLDGALLAGAVPIAERAFRRVAPA